MGERIMVEELVEEGVQELGRGGDGGEVVEVVEVTVELGKISGKLTYLYALAQNTKFCF